MLKERGGGKRDAFKMENTPRVAEEILRYSITCGMYKINITTIYRLLDTRGEGEVGQGDPHPNMRHQS